MSSVDDESKSKRISEEVVEKIKKNGIKMKSPYYFIIFSLLWLGLGAFLFAVSLILLAFSIHYSSEYEIIGLLAKGYFSCWFFVPFVGVIIAVFLIYLSSRFYRKGRICCRHEDWMLLLAIGVAALLALFVLVKIDFFNDWREEIEEHRMMQNFIISGRGFWSDSERGRISGEVIGRDEKKEYILIKNKKGELQKINTGNCSCGINHRTAKEGEIIKSIGDFDDKDFQAKGIWYQVSY